MLELIRGENLSDFYRSFRSSDVTYIAHMLANKHGGFLELSEYGVGGWQSFIVILKGREGRGWGACVEQMRKVVNFLEPHSKAWEQRRKNLGWFSIVVAVGGEWAMVVCGDGCREGS